MELTGPGMCFQTKDVQLRWVTEESDRGLVEQVDCSSVEGGIVESSDSRNETASKGVASLEVDVD